MVEIKNDSFLGIDGGPVHNGIGGPPLTMAELVKTFVMSIPREKITMEDCALGAACYQAAAQANGSLRFGDMEHKWLLAQVRAHGPAFLGLNAVKMEEALKAELPQN